GPPCGAGGGPLVAAAPGDGFAVGWGYADPDVDEAAAAAGGLPVPVVADDPRVEEPAGEAAPLALGRGRVRQLVLAADLVDGERLAGVGGGHVVGGDLVDPCLVVVDYSPGLRRGRGLKVH